MLRISSVITGYEGTPWYTNIFYGEDDRPNDGVNALQAFWSELAPLMFNSLVIQVDPIGVVINEATGLITGTAVADTPDPIPGEAADSLLPIATQGLIRWQTGQYVGGRQVKGKLFVPGLTEASSNGGYPTPDAINTMRSAAANIVGDPLDTNVAGVYSRKNHVWKPISAATVWDHWAVLRSRRD